MSFELNTKTRTLPTANIIVNVQHTARVFREQLINSTAARISFLIKFAMRHRVGGNHDSDEH